MDRTQKRIAIAVSGAILTGLLFWALFPPLQAERRFFAAQFGSAERCLAARDAADAWASFGMIGRSHSWRQDSETACATARLNAI